MPQAQASSPRPATYFAKREIIYPKRVAGRFRNLKWVAMTVTLGIYYLAPFIRWDRGPGAPNQAILIDLYRARAYWFFIEIWPQEIYLITGLLILAAVALFFVTSLFGRVWCGYFCPQTVWTDLFIWVERIVQGDRVTRRKLTEGPWTFEKIWKKALTHFLWIAIAWCTAGSFVLYFNDAPTLVRSFFEFNVSPTVLMFIAGLTFSTYLMAGFAREQVCFYMCPYARFQSAMFDPDTLIIGYDAARGEPRGHHKKGESWGETGHCIDCTACVQVCPTGIDIRDGLQMQCIACGLCVDACDGIMDKIGLPRGLIRYDSEKGLAKEKKARLLRPRTVYYAGILGLVGSVMLYALITRPVLELHVLHDRNPLFVKLSDGALRNGYEIKILNKARQPRVFALTVAGLEKPGIAIKGAGDVSADNLPVPADGVAHYHAFVTAVPSASDRQDVIFTLKDVENGDAANRASMFISR